MEKTETIPNYASAIRMFKKLYEKALGESVEDHFSKEVEEQLQLKEREVQEKLLQKESQATLRLLQMGLSPEKIVTALDISLEKVLEIQTNQKISD